MQLASKPSPSPARRALLALLVLFAFGAGLGLGGYRPTVEHACPTMNCPPLELDVLASECQAARCAADHADDDHEFHAEPEKPRKVWPQVLSVFTSRDPLKPDLLAGSSSAWPLPPGPVTMANMVPRGTPAMKLPMDYEYRRVRPDDFGIALRGVKRYTRAEICQVIDGTKCCAIGPTITTGPFIALCRKPEDCSPGRGCKRQVGDITRPGDDTVYWRTTQIAVDGPCEHRGAVDVTPAFQDVCGFRPMLPATVRLIR